MRIRTDGKYEYRLDPIERAADFYDCNKTKAIVKATDDVPKIIGAVETVLNRDDLTLKQRKEIAATLSTTETTFDVSQSVDRE